MALPDLLRALRQQAADRRVGVLADADEEAVRIASESASQLGLRRRDFVAKARREEEELGHRALARAEQEASEKVLLARDLLLARVRSALDRRIAGAERDPLYLAVLPRELRDALERLPTETVVVRTRPALAGSLDASLQGLAGLRVETTTDIGTGFTVLDPENAFEIDATLETRLELSWPQLAVAVLSELAR